MAHSFTIRAQAIEFWGQIPIASFIVCLTLGKFLVLTELHFLMYKIRIMPTWKSYCLCHIVGAKCMLIVVIGIFY